MRRFSDLFVWIPVVLLLTLFLGGVLYSFLVEDVAPHVESTWHGK